LCEPTSGARSEAGLVRKKGIINNSRYVVDGYRVFIEAIKDIPPASEILVSYGKEYWDVMRRNAE